MAERVDIQAFLPEVLLELNVEEPEEVGLLGGEGAVDLDVLRLGASEELVD